MKVIVITGQTATGKTRFALELTREFSGELINFDSRQIYKHLDIITGKDLKKVWLYDVVDPKKYFSSYEYVRMAVPIIKKILLQNRTPILVGGTYFYLKHLLYDITTGKIKPNWKLRKQLANKTVKQLQQILKKLSPQLIDQLNHGEINNPQRLIRKIEIASFRSINSPIKPQGLDILPQQSKTQTKIILADKLRLKNIKVELVGLKFKTREKLVREIRKRVKNRLKKGAVEEVRSLLKNGYSENDPGLKTIGYQQIIAYLKGKLTKQQAIEQWITKEIQYAKRQYTFMKKDKNIKWRSV